MPIYFDNAATTHMLPEVIDTMHNTMLQVYGNPSSIHHFGRQAKVLVENARKTIARLLHVSPAEIIFTSSGTEASNLVLHNAIMELGIKSIITSPIEHHAVLEPLHYYEHKLGVKVQYVSLDSRGHIDFEQFEQLLQKNPLSLVVLMHANNEIGNLLSIKEVSKLCRKYDAMFFSDMVQSIARYNVDLQVIDVDFVNSSAHKFHGPKGVGFLYANNNRVRVAPQIYGGAQERNQRAGTENVAAIAGMAKALSLAHESLAADMLKVTELKQYFITQLKSNFDEVAFLGDCENGGLYSIVNVLFPPKIETEMLVMKLDIAGIAVSSGSACSSGTNERSHVANALNVSEKQTPIRFSFSKFNTKEEIDFCLEVLKK